MGLFQESSWGVEEIGNKTKKRSQKRRKKQKEKQTILNSEIDNQVNKKKRKRKKKSLDVENKKVNLTNSPKLKKFGGTNFSKSLKSKQKKLENNLHPQKGKSNEIQESSKSPKKVSKKRKLQNFEEAEKVIKVKRRKKGKKENIEKVVPEVSKKNEGKMSKFQAMLENKKREKTEKKLNSLSLRERMLAQLRSSRFRFLNETLYKNESSESKNYFKDDPEAFLAYHEGYKQQVAHWPLNPLDVIIESIKKMPKNYIVADFGCGEAKLADSIPQTVHSFDFVAVNEKVKACDMSHTPLLTNSVNVVVFCLSLMGTNLSDYLLEANRVLKKGGIMKIAEVESRFENVENFINLVSSYGFTNTMADISNNLFYFLDFKKEKDLDKGKKKLPTIELKPCLYKKR